MRRPRMHVRTLMIAVAVVAVATAGWVCSARWRRRSAEYRYTAWGYGENVRMELLRLAKLKKEYRDLVSVGKFDYLEMQLNAARIEQSRARIAANANLVQLYEHAAGHPWEAPPLFAEALEGVEDGPIPKRIATAPYSRPPNPYSTPRPKARETTIEVEALPAPDVGDPLPSPAQESHPAQ